MKTTYLSCILVVTALCTAPRGAQAEPLDRTIPEIIANCVIVEAEVIDITDPGDPRGVGATLKVNDTFSKNGPAKGETFIGSFGDHSPNGTQIPGIPKIGEKGYYHFKNTYFDDQGSSFPFPARCGISDDSTIEGAKKVAALVRALQDAKPKTAIAKLVEAARSGDRYLARFACGILVKGDNVDGEWKTHALIDQLIADPAVCIAGKARLDENITRPNGWSHSAARRHLVESIFNYKMASKADADDTWDWQSQLTRHHIGDLRDFELLCEVARGFEANDSFNHFGGEAAPRVVWTALLIKNDDLNLLVANPAFRKIALESLKRLILRAERPWAIETAHAIASLAPFTPPERAGIEDLIPEISRGEPQTILRTALSPPPATQP